MSDLRPSYGDVTAEYRAAREGAALAAGLHDLVWVEGPDAVAFLDGQVSQDVAGLEVGTVGRSFLLGPKGKLRALLWVLRGEDRVGLIADGGRGDQVREDLEQFLFRVKVEIRVEASEVFDLWGATAERVLSDVGRSVGAGWSDGGEAITARIGSAPDRFVVTGIDEAPLIDAGAVRGGEIALTTVRIEAGEPVMGVDVDEATIPQETGLVEEAVSFTKGCYVGQELVARIDSRGRVNRRLVGIVVAANVVPPVGAVVMAGADDVGTVTSVGESLALRAPIAMGSVRREVEAGSPVELRWEGGSVGARVEEFPLDDFAVSSHTSNTS